MNQIQVLFVMNDLQMLFVALKVKMKILKETRLTFWKVLLYTVMFTIFYLMFLFIGSVLYALCTGVEFVHNPIEWLFEHYLTEMIVIYAHVWAVTFWFLFFAPKARQRILKESLSREFYENQAIATADYHRFSWNGSPELYVAIEERTAVMVFIQNWYIRLVA